LKNYKEYIRQKNMYQSDKLNSQMVNRYIELFDANEKLNILEVGIAKGGFLNWLSDHFKNATIYGLDIDISRAKTLGARTKIFQCDQNDASGLEKIGKEYGPFDLIMDDGRHTRRETETTFNTLWKYVNDKGWYSIEDWGMGYSQDPLYAGMSGLILSIMANRRALAINRMRAVIDTGYSIALFEKMQR